MADIRSVKHEKTAPKPYVGYAPKSPVRNLMKDALQWAEKLQEHTAAGDTIKKVFEKQSKDLRKEKRRLERRKMDVMNKHIFPSMANLTVFLEAMAKSPYVDKMFEDEVKELFLATSKENENKRRIFERFIMAISRVTRSITNKDGTTSRILAPDDRLILCDIMQESIIWAMLVIGKNRFRHERFIDVTLMPDMNRAYAWTTQFAYEARKNLVFDEERRPPQF